MDIIYNMKREMFRRRYSNKTISTYVYCFKKFLDHCKKDPLKITKKDVKDFLYAESDKLASESTLNLYLQSIKFPMENILNRRGWFIKLPYSKVPKKLPIVLSKPEIKQLIDAITNDKHKLMIKLMYSAGLRVSELLNLKIEDLDFNSFSGRVRRGKCNKDRLFILARSIISILKIHVKGGEGLVFKGRNGKYSIRSVQEIIRKATKKAGIKKNVHPHTLRHSFATHLIESGYAVNSVQTLLGHNSPDTTMIYVHSASPCMINVESPLDSI
ncbi:MAG: tyrosine-type recombinase/integrase [Nanobdellota archaeon]